MLTATVGVRSNTNSGRRPGSQSSRTSSRANLLWMFHTSLGGGMDFKIWSTRPSRAFFLFLLVSQTVVADIDAPCYSPNGARAPGYFACDPTAYITSCCPKGWTCYSNSMCVVTDPSTANSSYPIGTSIRGTCTNPVWNNAICGDYCLKSSDVDGSLKACGDNKWCCSHDESCNCANGAFNVNPGIVQTIIGIVGLEHTQTSMLAASPTVVGTRTASPTIFKTTISSKTGTETGKPTGTAEPAKKKAIDKPGTKAGIAIGVLAAVALVAVAGWVIYKRYPPGTRWKIHKSPEVPQTTQPISVDPALDPYIKDSATNPQINLPIGGQSQNRFDGGDAPYGNAYERSVPSRGPLAHQTGHSAS
ncbi:hypothetical protein BCR34DRAFT_27717 [Clohesyomyces aquaticus]|uniref:Mid2 domain-containing protein n=1 Tax=Clohesyomyces aquaticus TaxID=1231657 RepID=A0A1Y1ZBE0_9PLEO|nr:hypothetical protein BCR34DRAFT_27717 [Clohesyomyces aquaticus]